jgi:hypothetical protein
MTRTSTLALVALLCGCAPPSPDEETGCETGSVVVDAQGLSDGDTLTLEDDGEGGLQAVIDARLDGIDEGAQLASLGVSLIGVPRPPSDAAPGDDGQACIAQGGGYLCSDILRCTDELCRLIIADRTIAPVAPTCGDDHALHLDDIALPITQLMTADELDGYEVELRVAAELAEGGYESGSVELVLDLQ